MHSLNTLSLKRNKLILFLSITFIVFGMLYPLIRVGKNSAFLAIDPDMVYIANALSYIKYKIISYHDHPGVSSIFLISIFMIPVRIFTSGDFIKYVFNNFSFIVLYLRALQSILLIIGLFVYTLAVEKISKNFLLSILTLIIFLSFTPIYFLGSSISAETLSFLLGSLWILFFALYLKNKNNDKCLYLLSFLSGITFANRATSIIFLLTTLLILVRSKPRFKIGLFVILLGFVTGIIPSIDKIFFIIKRVFFFASSSGVHGEGVGLLFNFQSFVSSVLIYLQRDWGLVTLLVFVIIILLIMKSKIDLDIYFLGLIAIILTIAFMKFPLAHYQIANYQVLTFFMVFTLNKLNNKFIGFFLILYTFYGIYYFNNYYKNVTHDLTQIASQNSFFEKNPSKLGRIWGWARSEEFSKLWVNEAGGGIFKDYLSALSPQITEYSDNKLFDKCWDQLYIQGSQIGIYKSKYPDEKVEITKIENSQDLYLIMTNNCNIKKP